MISALAAIMFALVTTGVAGFQVALVLGAPWGAYAMGGIFPGKYPPLMRFVAGAQAVLLILIALVVLSRAGLVLADWAAVSTRLVWVVVAFSAVALALNTITPSAGERRVWAPTTATMLICSLIVALAAGD